MNNRFVSARRLLVGIGLAGLFVALGGAGAASGVPEPGISQARFQGMIAPINAQMRARMTSWRRGCPVAVSDLRLLTLSYVGFDHRVHRGELVVERPQAISVLHAMRALYRAQFPIRTMRLVEAYGSSDDRSMAADNTSAFNCRRVEGGGTWSAHAYGLAIDINPLENPEVRDGQVYPPAGAAFLNRSRWAHGMIHRRDVVVRAFAAIGWRWGGTWHSPKDYQHFSATGR